MSDSVRPHRRQPTRLPRPWDSPGKNTGVGCHFLLQCMKVKSESEVAQSCLTPSDPMDCSPPGSSVHGIFQARGLGWGATAFSVAYTRGAQTWDCDYFATSEVHGALQAQCGLPQPVQVYRQPRGPAPGVPRLPCACCGLTVIQWPL